MDKAKYEKLVGEVYSLIDADRLREALSLDRWAKRVDMVQDLLRDAVRRSSVGMFCGVPYFFGGQVYESVGMDVFGNLVYDLMRKCGLPYGDYGRVEVIIKVCKRVVASKELRPDNAVVVFSNCVLDMNDRTVHPFGREYVQMTSMPYEYNPREHVFLWKQFLDEVLPNGTWQRVFQEFLGSIFIDRRKAKMETMLVLRGPGSNGKSVVFDTVTGILGRENVSNFGIGSLIAGSEKKKNIAFINGKRLNYCSEIQAIDIARSSDTLKALISGEPVEARPMYGDNFTAYNIPLLMANANRMPFLKDWSYGMRRRICIIPFEVEIPKHRQRKTLSKDLEREYSAIFNWVMEGRDRFIANGYKLTDSRTLEKVMDEYLSESCSVMRFMSEMDYMRTYECVADAEPRWIPSGTLYRQYLRWCGRKSVPDPENAVSFGRILGEAGYRKRRSSKGNLYGIYGAPSVRLLKDERKNGTNTEDYEEE